MSITTDQPTPNSFTTKANTPPRFDKTSTGTGLLVRADLCGRHPWMDSPAPTCTRILFAIGADASIHDLDRALRLATADAHWNDGDPSHWSALFVPNAAARKWGRRRGCRDTYSEFTLWNRDRGDRYGFLPVAPLHRDSVADVLHWNGLGDILETGSVKAVDLIGTEPVVWHFDYGDNLGVELWPLARTHTAADTCEAIAYH